MLVTRMGGFLLIRAIFVVNYIQCVVVMASAYLWYCSQETELLYCKLDIRVWVIDYEWNLIVNADGLLL